MPALVIQQQYHVGSVLRFDLLYSKALGNNFFCHLGIHLLTHTIRVYAHCSAFPLLYFVIPLFTFKHLWHTCLFALEKNKGKTANSITTLVSTENVICRFFPTVPGLWFTFSVTLMKTYWKAISQRQWQWNFYAIIVANVHGNPSTHFIWLSTGPVWSGRYESATLFLCNAE